MKRCNSCEKWYNSNIHVLINQTTKLKTKKRNWARRIEFSERVKPFFPKIPKYFLENKSYIQLLTKYRVYTGQQLNYNGIFQKIWISSFIHGSADQYLKDKFVTTEEGINKILKELDNTANE